MKNVARIWLALLGFIVIAAPLAGQWEGVTTPEQETLRDRMHAFLVAVGHEEPEEIAAFFPRADDLTWVHTLHKDEGTRVSLWRFPASDIPRALKWGGPLSPSFSLLVERQPIGLFRHQTMTRQAFARRKGWRLVRGTRFVPAGEPETAGLFVEWRREAGVWVVAAFGDEGFDTEKPPDWCC
jgi:hypothetical protein